jgi:hypothetical protein
MLCSDPVHNVGYGDSHQSQYLLSHQFYTLIHTISVYKLINLFIANYGEIIDQKTLRALISAVYSA